LWGGSPTCPRPRRPEARTTKARCVTVAWLVFGVFALFGQKTDERIATYSKAVAAQPASAHLQSLLARAYIQKMRETVDFSYLDRASSLVEAVLVRDPGNYEALRLRSEIDMERHEFARVAEYSEEMTRYTPDDPANWGSLGDASMELGRYDAAREAYSRMLALRPDLASYNRIAWYQFVNGHVDQAIALMKNAISADSPAAENVAWCWNDLGNIYFKTGRLSEAEEAYSKALQVFPGYYPAYAGMGRVRGAQKRWKEAADNFRHAQATVPMPEFAAALEDLYGLAGNPVESRKQRDLLEAIDRMNRASGERTNRNVAIILADHDRDLNRAAELADNELKVRPDVYTQDAVAWVRYKQKRYAEAKAAAVKALALHTPEPAFYYHAGLIAAALGRSDEAMARLQRARELNAGFDPVQGAVLKRTLATTGH
jgi:tetratricopeptide (TPR) repeat protein